MDNNNKAMWGFLAGFFAGITVGVLVSSDERKEAVRRKAEDLGKNISSDVSQRVEKGIATMNQIAKTALNNVSLLKNTKENEETPAETNTDAQV